MKHTKKMVLVDLPNEVNDNRTNDLFPQSDFLPNYIAPKTGFNLDNELRQILMRDDISDHDKWQLYNQSFQRFLFLLDEERRKNIFQNFNVFNKAPSSRNFNSLTRQMIPSSRQNFGVNKLHTSHKNPFMEEAIRKVLKSNRADIYNQNFQRGQYDFSPYKTKEKNLDFSKSMNESHFQSALDLDLPSSDSEEEENEESKKLERKATKRQLFDTPRAQKKHLRKEKKAIYSYGYEPLQRWVINTKANENRNKLKNILQSLPSTSQNQETDETEEMEIEEISRKRRHEREDIIPSKTLRLDTPFDTNKRATVSLSRLPLPLTKERIQKILREDKKSVKIRKWEKTPKRITRQTRNI